MIRSAVLITTIFAASASAAITGHETLASYQSATATWSNVLQNFDGFPTPGPTTITSLPGISSLSGSDAGGTAPRSVQVRGDSSLPFPMFTPPTSSRPNFMSLDMSGPAFATGKITLNFDSPQNGMGMYIADDGPLDTFRIEFFDGSGASLGFISSAGPKTNSFFGATSTVAFSKAVIGSNAAFDSWGVDDLRWGAVPTPSTLAAAGLATLIIARRRR